MNVRLTGALLLVCIVAAGGWLALRDSGLVAVDEVEVSGTSGPQAAAIRDALTSAARDMTTLHVRDDQLEEAVSSFTRVKSVSAAADFPHTLRVRVHEHVPVAAVGAEGAAVPVTGNGTVLKGVEVAGLPAIGQELPPAGGRVTDRRSRRLLQLLDEAPKPLREKAARAYSGPRGLTVRLTDGPVVHFGSGARLRAKWASLVAVLSSPESRGAAAIDVRVPEHPAAAGLEQGSTQLGQPSTGN